MLAQAQGINDVTLERANAQVHRFPQEHFDLAISRFGTMFFDNPVAAFANVRRALRPAGRLVMMVWQAGDRNEWDVAIRRPLTGPGGKGLSGPQDRIRSPYRRPGGGTSRPVPGLAAGPGCRDRRVRPRLPSPATDHGGDPGSGAEHPDCS